MNKRLTAIGRRALLSTVIVCFMLLTLTSETHATAGIFERINFQGKLQNASGTNVTDGSYSITFTLYDASSGGSNLWDEVQTVTVADGVFQVELGSVDSTIANVDFNSDTIYLGVKVESDSEMTPRIRFTAVPYAFNAEKVNGLTVTNTTGTFTLAAAKTLSVNNTLTFSGTDGTTFTFPSGTGTVVTLDSTATLTNKTLTTPRFADGGYIADSSGNEMLIFDSNASAVNELTISNGATGVGPTIIASGETNVPLTINSKATGALTLDSGTTGAVNLGTSNNAKTISIGTGNAGNTISVGTNNTVSDTISIGSALDNVSITGDSWSITDAGALTVASCTGCGGGSQTPWTSDIDADGFDLGDLSNLGFRETTGAPTGTDVGLFRDNTGDLNANALSGKSINLQVAGADEYNFSATGITMNSNDITGAGAVSATSIALGTTPAAAGTLRIPNNTYVTARNAANSADINLIKVNGSNLVEFGANTAAFTLGGAITGNSQNITGVNSLTASTLALGTTPAAAGTLMIPNNTYITARNAANSADINLIKIDGSNLVAFGANTAAFTLGGAVTGNSQDITGLGSVGTSTLTASGAIAANGGITFDAATDTLGAHTLAGTLDANSNIITNIGSTATDFTTSGSLAIGLDAADSNGALMVDNVAQSNSIIVGKDNGVAVFTVADVTGTAVEGLTITGNTTGAAVTIAASSGSTNIPLTINSKGSGALTLDSTATGTVNLGTSNNAKTISIGTGNAGNTISVGTNNTVSDTISIGSALDNVSITGDSWSITDAGALTVASCTGCGGGSQTPWTSDIDADGFDLGDLSNLGFRETTGAPTGTDVGLFRDNTGDLNANALSGKSINLQIAGSDEYNFSSTGITMNSNDITGAGAISATSIALGTTPAAAGTLRLPNNTFITARNAANSADINLIKVNGSNLVEFGANTAAFTLGGAVTGNSQDLTGLSAFSAGGTITFSGMITDANAVLYTTTTGVVTRVVETETASQCLLSGAGASGVPTWGSCGGGSQTPWTSDIDGDNFSLLDMGTNITARAGLTVGSGADSNLTLTPGGTGDTIISGDADSNFQLNFGAAPTVDMHIISNSGFGTTTDGVDGLYINFVQADDAGVDTNYGLNIALTAASDDAGEVLGAINLTVTGQTAENRERGITIGSGFDEDIYFASASAQIRMQNGGEIEFTDGSYGGAEHNDLPLARVKEYFTAANYGVVESTGFINIDGSFRMDQFVRSTLNITADAIGSAQRLGDYMDWSLDEAGTGAGGTNTQQVGCVARTGGDTNFASASRVNGAMQIVPDTTTVTNAGNSWCMVHHAAGNGSTATNNGILQVANKFIVYYKVRLGSNITNSASYRYVYLGVNNLTGGTTGRPANNSGIWFSNTPGNQTNTGTNYTAGTTWLGNVNNGTNATNHSTVGCSGANLSINTATNAWALMRIEARATNDVRFFMDTDVSNGVALSECGSVTNNIPTNPMKPSIMLAQSGTNSQTWDMVVDLFAFVQDDPRDGSSGADGLEASEQDYVPTAPDPIYGADLAENYVMDGEFDIGDIVSLGDSPGIAKRATRPNDRKVLGVISESPGLMIGEASHGFTTAPIALTGRVPVKVSGKNGDIKIGDPITSSDIPGVGMRAITPGKIIGTAMEDFSGDAGKIMIAVNVGYYIGDEADTALIEQPEESILAKDADSEVLAEATQSAGLSDVSTGSAMLSERKGDIENAHSMKDSLRIGANFILEGTSINIMGEDLKLQPLRQGGVNIMDGLVIFTADGVTFAGKTIFETEVIFKGIATFASDVVFQSAVRFDAAPIFGKDTAGYATIQKGKRFVDVLFDNEYKDPPVVNISIQIQKLDDAKLQELKQNGLCAPDENITMCEEKIASEILNDNFRFAVSSKNTQGFMIVLNKEAPVDITFSWQALAVKSPISSKNDALLPRVSSVEQVQDEEVNDVPNKDYEKVESEIKREINVTQADKIQPDLMESLIDGNNGNEVNISSQSGAAE